MHLILFGINLKLLYFWRSESQTVIDGSFVSPTATCGPKKWWMRHRFHDDYTDNCWPCSPFCGGWSFSRFSRRFLAALLDKLMQGTCESLQQHQCSAHRNRVGAWGGGGFISQPVVNDLPERTRCVTAEQGTVVLMRKEDGQTSLTTHTALCLSLCPPSLA